MPAQTRHHDNVAFILFANPPVNALSLGAGLIPALADELRAALANPAISAIVIGSEGKLFSAGADIGDFDVHPDTRARMCALTSALIEEADKPVVVAVQGQALGGGLELALAAHYRIASADAKFGLPEVTLGLLPGGGGTQRLPRLVGVAKALDMMIGGKPVGAVEAERIGLIDRIATGELHADAIAWAKTLGGKVRRVRDIAIVDAASDALAVARAKAAKSQLSQAPAFIIDCVEAAIARPFDAAMAIEGDLFERLRLSEASAGLRHAFSARREASRIPGLAKDIEKIAVDSTAVIGGGTMGGGIALALVNAGVPVILIEPNAEALAAAALRIHKTIDADVVKGRLSAAAAEKRKGLLTMAPALDAAAKADLVIEAVFEDMGVKEQVFGTLDGLCKPGTILASNTSTLDLDVIAAFTRRPDRVIGMHFFSPANIMRLLEVVRGAKTAPAVLATVMGFAKRIGKTGVVAGVCDGFIGNRIFEEYLRQAYFLVEEGASPWQVDAAMQGWGMAMGPFRTMDLAGQDIGWNIRKRRAVEQPDRPYSKIPDLVCELGRFGQKTRAGFYLYADGRTAEIDPAIDTLVAAHRAAIGVTPRAIDDREIVDRCTLAMVNEGARILAEGMAYRALDIDVVYLDGYGFPAERGGPMFYADRMGLPALLDRIRGFAGSAHGWAWEPAPLLVELAGAGRSLASFTASGAV